MKPLFIIAFLLACGHAEQRDDTQPASVSTYAQAADRLMTMLDSGWVVSRWPDGTIADQGDSLIFTGIAMGALDCARGAVPEAALATMLRENHGIPYRHPTIKGEYSLDGLLGLWWGISERTKRCPESRPLWTALLPEHAQAISVEPFFGFVLQQVMADLGLGEAPNVTDRGRLGAAVSAWAIGTVGSRAASYRLHLGYLALSVVDAPKGKGTYCEAVKDAQIALIENFCGRPGLAAWADAFAYNRYVYAFQRAAWEAPDGRPSLETPAIDLLMALLVLYPEG